MMATFADIHCHALCHVDDGAKDMELTRAMIDAEYRDGVRYLCFTPHYHPGYYGLNEERAAHCFAAAVEYAKRYPDLQLALANELHYAPECLAWIREGLCRRMGNTRCILVDFRQTEEERAIVEGLTRILGGGYIPILAHAERYDRLRPATIRSLKQNGVMVQVNAGSVLAGAVFGNFGGLIGVRARRMLSRQMVDFISTDAHDLRRRPPNFSSAYGCIAKKYGSEYAQRICRDHAVSLFFGSTAEAQGENDTRNDMSINKGEI